MANPITRQTVVYSGLGTNIGDSLLVQYNFAFGIPDFSNLIVVEQTDQATELTYDIEDAGNIRIYQNGTTPASGVFILTLDVPADSFVRDIEDGNIFEERTLEDLFTQSLMVAGAVSEGRLATLTQDLDMGTYKVTNMGDATDANDAVNKGQMDALETDLRGTYLVAVETARDEAQSAETGATSARDDAQLAQTGAETAQNASELARDASQLAQVGAETAETNAETAEAGAQASELKAQQWADEAEDVEVEAGQYSAYHWAQKAEETVSAGIPDGDKGDIVVSGTGTVWTIDSQAITNAKVADGTLDLALKSTTSPYPRANHTGTQPLSTISDAGALASLDTVDTLQIADDAVTLAKLASGTAGNIISYDASGDPVAVATGTSGQVLTSNGEGLPPTMQDAGVNASTTVKGVVEIATDAEVTAEIATGGTGASLVATPANMKKHQGVAKAWVNINNSDTIVDDYNISSLTDFGVSGYTLNFTNAMANTNYIVVGSGNIANNGSTIQCGIYSSDNSIGTPVTKTTSAVRVNVVEVNTNTRIPWLNTSFAIFGD